MKEWLWSDTWCAVCQGYWVHGWGGGEDGTLHHDKTLPHLPTTSSLLHPLPSLAHSGAALRRWSQHYLAPAEVLVYTFVLPTVTGVQHSKGGSSVLVFSVFSFSSCLLHLKCVFPALSPTHWSVSCYVQTFIGTKNFYSSQCGFSFDIFFCVGYQFPFVMWLKYP